MRYKVIHAKLKSLFEVRTNLLLDEGWVLQGGVSHDGNSYIQALTKED